MKIGVISDTHDNLPMMRKFVAFFNEHEVPVVIHCGDIVAPFCAQVIKDLTGKFYGVFGNNDGERFGMSRFFTKDVGPVVGDIFEKEIGGRKIIAFHHLPPTAVDDLARGGEYDLILKGHTHQVRNEKVGNALVVNPGEACGYLTGKCTAALVDLDALEAEIITLEDD